MKMQDDQTLVDVDYFVLNLGKKCREAGMIINKPYKVYEKVKRTIRNDNATLPDAKKRKERDDRNDNGTLSDAKRRKERQ